MARKKRIRGWLKKIFDRENLRKPIFWISLTGVLAILIGLVGSGLWFTEQSIFCKSCHIMKGPYESWQKSTHSRVRCTVCHVKPGAYQMIIHKPQGLLELWTVITENPRKPREVHPPGNENCDLCHKAKRTVSPSGDLKIPHASHIKLRGLKCVDCHRALVHTQNKQRQNRPPMIVCYKCHDGKKAPNRCDACHTEKAVPDDHTAADWLQIHSQKQKSDPEYCIKCHSWVKDYCSECHQRRPRSHAGKWRTNHQFRIADAGKDGCMHCHKDAMCIRCHGLVP